MKKSPLNEEELGAVYRGNPGVVWEKSSPPHGRKASEKGEVFVDAFTRTWLLKIPGFYGLLLTIY